MNNKEIMNINECAEYLNCGTSTIRRLVSNNKIPYFRYSNKLMFHHDLINRWITNLHNDIDLGGYEDEL